MTAQPAVTAASLPSRIRHRFPILERLVYLNSCSQGALSDAVRDSYEAYLRDWDEKGSPWEYWVERAEAARSAFARLINAAPDEVAVTTSLSAGVSALATGLSFGGPRSNVVMTDYVHPTAFGQVVIAERALDVLAADGMVVRVRPSTLIAPSERTRWRALQGDWTYVYRALKTSLRAAGSARRAARAGAARSDSPGTAAPRTPAAP